MRIKKIALFISICFSVNLLFAQLDNNNFNLNINNPSTVGLKENLSVGLDYFSQWNGIDGHPKQFYVNTYSPLSSKMGVGLSYVNYKVGPVKENVLMADFSYGFKLKNKQKLRFGLKAGLQSVKIETINLSLPDGTTDPFFGSLNQKESDFLLGFGVSYKIREWQFGFGVPNVLNRNNIENTFGGETIRHYVFNTSTKISLSERINFEPFLFVDIPSENKVAYYVAANFEFKKIIGFGVNLQRDVYGIQLTSPKIANIFKLGFIYQKVNAEFGDADNSGFFGMADFNPIIN